MSLGRPEDAVEAFKAALGIEGYASKGKASANLGLAYAAMGFFEDAVVEFESARDEYGYELTGTTLEAYETARVRVRTEDAGPAKDSVSEGDTGAGAAEESAPQEDLLPEDGATSAAPVLPDADDEATRSFFTRTEDEMRKADRAARKQERAQKRTPKRLVLRIVIVLVVVLAIGGGLGAAFFLGYGYPTQEQTVTGLLDAYHAGATTYTDYWVAAPATDVTQAMRALPATFTAYTIDGVDRASVDSTVAVSVTLQSGAKQSFLVLLQREGVGWKVDGVQNNWGSLSN
jgi:tetratricopeptide (TPR) repeat protein